MVQNGAEFECIKLLWWPTVRSFHFDFTLYADIALSVMAVKWLQDDEARARCANFSRCMLADPTARTPKKLHPEAGFSQAASR